MSKLVTQPRFRAVGQTRGMADIFMSVTECSLPHIERHALYLLVNILSYLYSLYYRKEYLIQSTEAAY